MGREAAVKSCLKRAGFLLLSFAFAGCAVQNGQNGVLPGSAPIRPMDTYGGTTSLATSIMDSSPVLAGKSVAHFYVGIDEIDAISNGTPYPVLSFTAPYVVDLMQYQNGNALSLGQSSVPALSYTQYRFVLNTASSQIIFADGSSLPVSFKTNSSSQSSAKAANQTTTSTDPSIPGAVDVVVSAPMTLSAGTDVSLSADFNALESLTITNNAVYVRASMFIAKDAGKIDGTVAGSAGPVQNAVVAAVSSAGVVANTASTDAMGHFNLHALAAGTYQIVIYNSYSTAAGQSVTASGQSSTAAWVYGPSITVTSNGSVSAGTLAD